MNYLCALFLCFITQTYASSYLDDNSPSPSLRGSEELVFQLDTIHLAEAESKPIKNIAQCGEILSDFTNEELAQTAIFIDFDDTIVTLRTKVNHESILWALSTDHQRTYRQYFKNACEGIMSFPNDYTSMFNYYTRTYIELEIIDDTIATFIATARTAGAHVKVLSGKPFHNVKDPILNAIGLNKSDYMCASKKTPAVVSEVKKYSHIKHIIMIDNSRKNVLEGMREWLPSELMAADISAVFYPYEHTVVKNAMTHNHGADLKKEIQTLWDNFQKS